jgi:hypothetical protein
VHEQRRLARGGRALERRRGHTDDHPAARERLEHLAQGEGAGDRVELVAPLDQAGRGLGVQVRPQGDDHHVALERTGVGLHPLGRGVDGADRRLHERDAGLHQVGVAVQHTLGDRAAEHHVELREPEDEPLALVDQRDVDAVAELFGQRRRQFEPTEAGTEHQDAHRSSSDAAGPSPCVVAVCRRCGPPRP